ncbi:MAG TPA: apolipoprotein N-acyltransferase [Rhizomicrobium sp.]|nr:apolipoprotein N-acyltransferase [Rhizomicrobium sp.]
MIAGWLARAGDFVRGLAGWRRLLFAFAMGLVSVLSFAPFFVFPAMLLGFATLVLLIDGAHSRRRPVRNAALAGWAFGFGYFLGGLYWVGYAFEVDALAHAWQIPFVEILLPGGLALYVALAAAAASMLWRKGPARILVFAISYGIAEWLRGHLLTGFPWNLPAYGWGASLGVMQGNALVGAYGMSLLTLLLGGGLALLFERGWRDWKFAAAMVGLFVAIWIGGEARLALTPTTFVPNVTLRIVQPDVPQAEKFPLQYRARNWRELMQMSVAGTGRQPDIVVWPESAPPFFLLRQPEALDDVALLTAGRTVLLTGAVRAEQDDDRVRFFNSLLIFAHGGRLIGRYDKFHLVPFGEYLPLKGLFAALGMSKLVDSPGDFSAGDGPHTYDLPGAPSVGPLICYEVVFPGAVTGPKRPGFLANVTDDSWFGPPRSTGPQQHFLIAQVRAIEEGLPLVRAANTGISGVIDGTGRVLSRLGPGQKAVLDSLLPQALHPTPYAELGDITFVLLLAASAICAFMYGRKTAPSM